MDLRVILSQQLHYVRSESSNRFVDLRSLWIWDLDLHGFLAEVDSVAEHLTGKLFVEIRIHSLGVLGSGVIGDVACAKGLSEEDVVIIQKLQFFFILSPVVTIVLYVR